jgi:type IV pilus assembly protein PilB
LKIVDIEKKLPRIKKKLGEILVEAGLIDPKTLEDALEAQKVQNKRLGQILIDMKTVDDIQLADVLAKQIGVQSVRLDQIKIHKNATTKISGELAEKFSLIPLQTIDKKLVVAMSNPLDHYAVQDIRFAAQMPIYVVVAPLGDIKNAIEEYYPKKDLKEDILPSTELDASMEVIQQARVEERTDQDLASLADLPPVIRFTNAIIADAIKLRASDIHVEPQIDEKNKPKLIVRCRIDGIMTETLRTDRHVHPSLVSRIKVISGLDISERRKPQDGKAQVKFENKNFDLRVSTIPTTYGEKVTIRILNPDSARMGPEDLGFSDKSLNTISDAISRPQGIILVTGPTGSGKSSTLYACLNRLNSPSVNIITVEDPVEFDVAGINQVQINAKAGITFAAGLKSILRQDPDIVMVGEIRDAETAEIAFQAAQTGHMVLSTLHTNDAPSTVTRLLDLGLDDFQISAALIAVVGQRLVRKIHPDCKTQDEVAVKTIKRIQPFLSKGEHPVFWKGSGCNACQNSGYLGRMGIYEILSITPSLRNFIKPGVSSTTIKKAAIKQGFQAMAEDGIEKALQGLTTIEEIFRVAPPEISEEVQPEVTPKKKERAELFLKKELTPEAKVSGKATAVAVDEGKDLSAQPPKILIVDDEEIDRMIICDALESEDYVVVAAEDGFDALEKIEEEAPDLVVVDYLMPRMNGIKLIKALRDNERTRQIPIIMLTSIDDVESEVVVMKAGADDYLTKPVNRERFLIRVESLLRRSK